MSQSINGRLFLEPYQGGKKLELEVKKGFGTVKAKATLIGLKLIKEAIIHSGQQAIVIRANSVVFFNEEILAGQESYKKKYQMEGVDEEFVIGNYHDAVFIKEG